MNVLIWIKNVAVLLLSLLFLIIGINILLSSYNLKNPLEFVMNFFSASLLILVFDMVLVKITLWLWPTL